MAAQISNFKKNDFYVFIKENELRIMNLPLEPLNLLEILCMPQNI